METWNINKSAELYGIGSWGEGYFDVNQKGHVVVRPNRNGQEIDLREFVSLLVQRGIEAPVLVRFDGIIRDRVKRLNAAFRGAIEGFGYKGAYRPVYPIKVNQQRHVVDVVRGAGRGVGLGLEVGSKPELVAVLAIHDTPDALLLCNGYKDREFIELALLARKLGRRPIIIVEQLYELNQIIEASNRLGVEAEIGIRMKPSTKGSGRWEASAGEKAKFGLSIHEIVLALDELKRQDKIGWLKLLHFHIGSQVTAISAIKRTLREATRMFTEIHKMAPSLCMFDVGGGLAVDYDGSRTNFDSSMNYGVEEYARDIVDAIQRACTDAEVPHPDIITESGRATVAHHSILITQVIDVAPALDVIPSLVQPPTDHEILERVATLYRDLNVKNCRETLNDALSLRDEILERFNLGDLSLTERAYADKVFWHLLAKIRQAFSGLKYIPEELEKIEEDLRDTYFCNFSIFQSLPDSWAIDQLFPVMPLNRLLEEPTRRGLLADVSCDSDGKLDKFIDLKDVKNHVRLHNFKGTEPYYIGIFLVGAYQEILGDLHNLFGDTNAVHVDIDANGQIELIQVVEGDSVREVLGYVQYNPADLIESLRLAIEKSLREGKLTTEESAKLQKRYREALEGYTYLVVD